MLKCSNSHTSPISLEAIQPYYYYVQTKGAIQFVEIPHLSQRKFVGDFFGLLDDLRISSKYWDLMLLANQYTDPSMYKGESIIRMVDIKVCDTLMDFQTRIVNL